ncbi:MAG: transcription elongation factor GreB [Myxococcota bacterium]
MSASCVQSRCITPEGFQKLRDEHERLWKVERPKVTKEVQVAAAHGDRSENAEYIYGKRRLREIDSRLRFLSKRLDELTVVKPGEVAEDRVYFGAWVRLLDGEGKEVRYRLVGPDESDVPGGLISVESPVGRVLVGKEEGDEVLVRRPAGQTTFTILEIWYEEA